MKSMHFLVVEDEPDGQEVVANILGFFNISVDAVGSASEAFDLLLSRHYDCVIIDLYLPQIDGWQLLREIRNTAAIAHLPCVAITAYHSSSVRLEALDAGFDAYFAKPLDQTSFVRELMGIVENAS